MDVSPEMRELIIRTGQERPLGARRRRYLADTLDTLHLSLRRAEKRFGWSRVTLRKSLHERRSGLTGDDAFRCRGRKRAEVHWPHLLDDMRALVQDHVQTDPTFQTTRLYGRLSAAEVRRQLIQRKGYTDAQLPSLKTLTGKLNFLGFRLRQVAKCRPQKK